MTTKLKIFKIPKLNVLVIKQSGGKFFITDPDSIVIDIVGLAQIIKFMVFNGILSSKVLQGILEEWNSYGRET